MKHSLERLLEETRSELETLGAPLGKIASCQEKSCIELRAQGGCRRTPSGFELFISDEVLLEEDCRMAKDVIAHELIHTIDGCLNHDELFQSWMNRANEALDMNIQVDFLWERYGLDEKVRHQASIERYLCDRLAQRDPSDFYAKLDSASFL